MTRPPLLLLSLVAVALPDLARGDGQEAEAVAGAAVVVSAGNGEVTVGPPTALVTAELFCPENVDGCAGAEAALLALAARHPERLRVVYRHASYAGSDALELLLEAAHQGAYAAVREALAASRPANRDALRLVARRAGLDLIAVDAAWGEQRYAADLRRDEARRRLLGVDQSGVPAIAWNGVMVNVSSPSLTNADRLEDAYDEALARARVYVDAGVAPAVASERAAAAALLTLAAARLERDVHLPGGRVALAAPSFPARGAADAPVTIAVFGSLIRWEIWQTLDTVERLRPGAVRVVAKLNLVNGRGAQEVLERLAVAAAAGGFWRVVEVCPTRFSETCYGRAGLDPEIEAAARAGEGRAVVEADTAEAKALAIGNGLVVVVNGQIVAPIGSALPPLVVLVALIDAELAPGALGRLLDGP